ncbi:DNA recombination protein RmuC [Candidatus Methylospira mobilis]|nr:DNA recombination protein RmuC [Candidatus Methylospira mobilis]
MSPSDPANTEWLLYILIGIGALTLILQLISAAMQLLRSGRAAGLENRLLQLEQALRQEIAGNRGEQNQALRQLGEALQSEARQGREEMQNGLLRFNEQISQQFSIHSQRTAESLKDLRESVAARLSEIQQDNSRKLEQMRVTVDEKLHNTLEQRLGESFRQVSERLELVHKGLGEMQTLASGVGDLKKVLSNVKVRGSWGEVQLDSLLEQMLSPAQYEKNVAVRPGSNERVEFAIKLPGRDEHGGAPVWLPIDAKFPLEDYQRLAEAQESGDIAGMEFASKALDTRIRSEAKSIRDKYLEPPHTTDFGLMFLPVEGLYAEVIRRPGLIDNLQRDYRVTVVGPTTLTAILNSLQMGFRTLAIEKRSSEVWTVLGAVKSEFGKFGDVLAKTRKKLEEASNTIAAAEQRTRVIGQRLKTVEAVPSSEDEPVLLFGAQEQNGEE